MNILLTGGHSGIGLELSKTLIKEGHKLGLILRNERKKDQAIKDLGTSNIDFFFADLSKQEDIQNVAAEIATKWEKVDILFNNAGVLLENASYSAQGNEMHLEVNAIAPYTLTQRLKPILDKAENPTVVNTVTGGLENRKLGKIEELKRPQKFVKLFGSYMQSKAALLLMMNYLAKEWPQVRIVNVDPGPNKTHMTAAGGMPTWLKFVRNLMFPGPEVGGRKLYNATFNEEFKEKSGIYISWNSIHPVKNEISQQEIEQILA